MAENLETTDKKPNKPLQMDQIRELDLELSQKKPNALNNQNADYLPTFESNKFQSREIAVDKGHKANFSMQIPRNPERQQA